MKGFKVTNAKRTRICGIAASSLKELKLKAAKKFNILDNESNYKLILLDGTIVDSEAYFQTIPSQSLLIFAEESEEVCTGADIIYNALRAVNIEYLRVAENVKQFFEENIKEKLKVLSEKVEKFEKDNDKTKFSSRKDHQEWFEGLETNCSTKEDYLKRRCKDRINSYYYKACSDLRKGCNNSTERVVIEEALLKLKRRLSLDNYNGGYFDRQHPTRLCNEIGLFSCSGIWNKERCLYTESNAHVINPYRSREERIMFSTWNLDHRIEKSRTIIPCMLAALKSVILKKSNCFDYNYDLIYSLLFTSKNLRLVHIVCHDKGSHSTAKLHPEDVVISLLNGSKRTSNINFRAYKMETKSKESYNFNRWNTYEKSDFRGEEIWPHFLI